MNRGNLIKLAIIVVLIALGLCEVLIKDSPSIQDSGPGDNMLGMRLGLDLSGGIHLVYEADFSELGNVSSNDEMDGVVDIIENRVNAYGVSEPIIQRQGSDRISIQLPGIRDMEEAVSLIGSTAELDFRELTEDSWNQYKNSSPANPVNPDDLVWIPATGTLNNKDVHLTGHYLKRNTYVEFNQSTGEPRVAFAFKSDGASLFAEITGRLFKGTDSSENRPLGIFLDNELLSSPIVQAVISDDGVITGVTRSEAQRLKILLNAGALPVPLGHWEGDAFVAGPAVQDEVDPTLGADSLRKSLIAGLVGLFLVLAFMILYYRLPGALAACALIIYGILVMAIFKLIPVTLTLSGIAAFILSIGMAVDANVLIFERLREELRAGRTVSGAVEAGFNRAWSAIWDSNITTLIVCAILYWMGSNFAEPSVMGFALTLAIGISLSMFTAIFVTRSLLRLVVDTGLAENLWLFGKQSSEKAPRFEEQ